MKAMRTVCQKKGCGIVISGERKTSKQFTTTNLSNYLRAAFALKMEVLGFTKMLTGKQSFMQNLYCVDAGKKRKDSTTKTLKAKE